MEVKAYLRSGGIAFPVVITGSDMIARVTVAGQSLGQALSEHVHWASMTIAGLGFLFLPFAGSALICAWADRHAEGKSMAVLFALSLLILAYFYFCGFEAAQQAMLDRRWTAAALSVGLLPFFIGIPLLLALSTCAALVVLLKRRAAARR